MRLDAVERRALNKALQDVPGHAYLFGSRTRDDARGGDIDVLIASEADAFALSRQVAARFFAECEEKLDVVVMSPSHRTPEEQAFFNTLQLIPLAPAPRGAVEEP